MWGCRKHWYTLPAAIRKEIWAAYVPGQEITKDPSAKYLAIAHLAESWARKWEERRLAAEKKP